MSTQWETARHCHMALSLLAKHIKQTTSTSPLACTFRSPKRHSSVTSPTALRAQKRRRLSHPSGSPEGDGISEKISSSAIGPSNKEQSGDANPAESSSHASSMLNPETRNPSFRDPQFQSSSQAGPIPLSKVNTTTSRDRSGFSAEAPLLEMSFPPDSDSNYLTDGSNFDLNMVDLLQGANFDSLFDLIGQQYPSF